MLCSSCRSMGQRKDSESPTRFEPVTFRTPVKCANNWPTRDSWRTRPYTRFMHDIHPAYCSNVQSWKGHSTCWMLKSKIVTSSIHSTSWTTSVNDFQMLNCFLLIQPVATLFNICCSDDEACIICVTVITLLFFYAGVIFVWILTLSTLP